MKKAPRKRGCMLDTDLHPMTAAKPNPCHDKPDNLVCQQADPGAQ